jgi:glycosyltransferase involved in cell wall biosynthesis
MKIAILGTRGIPNNYGGFEQLAEHLSIGLVEKGHDVTVYNTHYHEYKSDNFKGVKIKHIYTPEKIIGSSGNIFYDYFCLIHAIKKKNDIVLECGYQSSALGLFLAPISKTRIITNMDGLDWKRAKWNKIVQKLTKWFEKISVKKSHYLIADNKGMQEYLKKKYKVRSEYIAYGTTIPNNIDPEFLVQHNVLTKEYYILVSRLEPENNIEIILDGYAQSKQEHPFLVVGNYNSTYGRFLVTKYNKVENIRFLNGIYDIDKLNSLRNNSLLYFHGHSVGGTNPSLLDAMACSCLIVAHDNDFNRDVLGKNGFFFKNSKDVTNYINTIKSNKGEINQFQNNNIKKIKEQYTWKKIVDDHEKLFLHLMAIKK